MEHNSVHLDEDNGNDSTSNELTQQLHHLRTILANSAFNINEIVSKSSSGEDTIDDELISFNKNTRTHEDNEEKTVEDDDGRISLAYERLMGIPQIIADEFALRTHTLDLSYNNLKDLRFLSNFRILHTLILDNNVLISENTLPYLPSLRILWLNKCGIIHLHKWLQRIRAFTPNVRQLSLMGNHGVRSSINCSSSLEIYDYMMCVIRTLPKLEYLDDVKVTDGQRAMARAYISARALNVSPIHFRNDFSSTPNLLSYRKYDVKIKRYHTKYGHITPHLMTKANTLQIDRKGNRIHSNNN